jgi:hypothetical protein
MEIDLIKEVQKAEKTAEEIVKSAEVMMHEKLKVTTSELQDLLKKTKENLRLREIEELRAAQDRILQLVSEEEKIVSQRIEALKERARGKYEKVIEIILDKLRKELQ